MPWLVWSNGMLAGIMSIARYLTLSCVAQEHQASLAADISTLQPQLADLAQHVIADSAAAGIKARRRADALSATCSVVEALQQLVPCCWAGRAGRAGCQPRRGGCPAAGIPGTGSWEGEQ